MRSFCPPDPDGLLKKGRRLCILITYQFVRAAAKHLIAHRDNYLHVLPSHYNLDMLKVLLSRIINIIKGIKIPQWFLAVLIVVSVFDTTSKMLNTFLERVKGIFESWRNPEERQQQYKIDMPHAFISVFSVTLAAILLYNRMFKLISVIIAIFASAFYLRYLIMVDGMKQREAKKAKKMAKALSTEKPEKADKKQLRRPPESVDEPEIRKVVYERQRSAASQHDDTDASSYAASMDLNSQFKGANAKLRRRLKDKLEERKDKFRQKKPLKTMFQNLKRSRDAGDTTDEGESEDEGEH